MKWNVLITCRQLQQTIDSYLPLFREKKIAIDMPEVVQSLSENDLLKIIETFDGVIAGDDAFTAKVLQTAKRLKVISRWGVGVDGVDLEAAQAEGIKVYNTPNVFDDEVADVVIGYAILLARSLHKIHFAVRSGEWSKIRGISLAGKSFGIVGVGSIGRAVIRRAKVLGMKLYGYDVAPIAESFLQEMDLRSVSLKVLLRESDFVSLNCNLTRENRHMIGARELQWMRPTAFLINTARGQLINQDALIQALQRNKLAGVALDVFETEPLPDDSPLLKFENCILGSHNSSNTIEAVMRVNELSIANLLRGLEEA